MNCKNYQPRKIETCKVIKNNSYEVGKPKIIKGKCEGYTKGYCDEPYNICMTCKFCIDYVEDK